MFCKFNHECLLQIDVFGNLFLDGHFDFDSSGMGLSVDKTGIYNFNLFLNQIT